jgi:hypothetical protein
VLNASTTFAENLFISLINPDIVQARVGAVQYSVFDVYLKSKDGSVRRAEIHLLKASADGLMGGGHVGHNQRKHSKTSQTMGVGGTRNLQGHQNTDN